MKKPLPTLTQTNLENAIAILDDLNQVLTKLNRMKTLPDRATDLVTQAVQLGAMAQTHLVTCDEISTDRLLYERTQEKPVRPSTRGH